jgi:hypothetical protein
MAETDKMLAEEAEFQLETVAAEGAQDGFMKEEKPRQ